MQPRPFFSTCVNWPDHLHAAKDFLDREGAEISRADFLPLVGSAQMRGLERGLGYGGRGGLTMAEDWHVRYFREPKTGIPFFVHSATEHVFAHPGEIEALDTRCRSGLGEEAPRHLVLLAFPEHLLGQDPPDTAQGCDAFEHHVFSLIDGDAAVILIEGAGRSALSGNDRLLLDRMAEILEDQGRLALHLRDIGADPRLEDLIGADLFARIGARITPEAAPDLTPGFEP